MLDEKEAVQQLERQRRHGEEIESHDHLSVILQKRRPPFTRVASALNSTQIGRDAALRDNEAELQHLAMDLGSSPVGIKFFGPREGEYLTVNEVRFTPVDAYR